MTIDVIIPTRDRPSQLACALSTLAQQDSKDFGIIVVDDGGANDAERICPTWSATVSRFDSFATRYPSGLDRAATAASMHPTPRYVVFLDDDCLAVPDLIARHRAVLARLNRTRRLARPDPFTAWATAFGLEPLGRRPTGARIQPTSRRPRRAVLDTPVHR